MIIQMRAPGGGRGSALPAAQLWAQVWELERQVRWRWAWATASCVTGSWLPGYDLCKDRDEYGTPLSSLHSAHGLAPGHPWRACAQIPAPHKGSDGICPCGHRLYYQPEAGSASKSLLLNKEVVPMGSRAASRVDRPPRL